MVKIHKDWLACHHRDTQFGRVFWTCYSHFLISEYNEYNQNSSEVDKSEVSEAVCCSKGSNGHANIPACASIFLHILFHPLQQPLPW